MQAASPILLSREKAGEEVALFTMQPAFHIRPAKPQDAEAILITHRKAIRTKAAPHYSPEIIAEWASEITPKKIDEQSQELKDPGVVCLVAEDSTGVFGFATAILNQEELRAVYVAPNPHPGVGAALLKNLEKLCTERGCKKLQMDASINAESFYNRHGYQSLEHGTHILRSGNGLSFEVNFLLNDCCFAIIKISSKLSNYSYGSAKTFG